MFVFYLVNQIEQKLIFSQGCIHSHNSSHKMRFGNNFIDLQFNLIFKLPEIIPIITQMSNYQELPLDIRKQLADFETKVQAVKLLKGSAKQQTISKHQKHAKRIRRLLQTYQYSIQSGSFETGVQTHKSQYKQFDAQLTRLQKNLEANRGDIAAQDNLFNNRPKPTEKIDYNNRQVVIELGNKAQKESEDALKRVLGNVNVMDEQANTIMVELDRQINKLDQIYDQLNDTETTLKRAQKHLKYFARAIYTDRLMICLIITIAIAIIVIIALAIAGKTPKAMYGA